MGVTPRNSFCPETTTPATAYQQFERLCKMKAFLVFAFAASATAQLKFGSDSTEAPKKDVQHEEYTVVRLLKHPQFNAGRLSNDIALLYTDRDINLNKANVNTACLPSCRDQFSHQFNNGTGVRCWVAGWGKNEVDGS